MSAESLRFHDVNNSWSGNYLFVSMNSKERYDEKQDVESDLEDIFQEMEVFTELDAASSTVNLVNRKSPSASSKFCYFDAGPYIQQICSTLQNRPSLTLLQQLLSIITAQLQTPIEAFPDAQSQPNWCSRHSAGTDLNGFNFNRGELWLWHKRDTSLTADSYLIMLCRKSKSASHGRSASEPEPRRGCFPSSRTTYQAVFDEDDPIAGRGPGAMYTGYYGTRSQRAKTVGSGGDTRQWQYCQSMVPRSVPRSDLRDPGSFTSAGG